MYTYTSGRTENDGGFSTAYGNKIERLPYLLGNSTYTNYTPFPVLYIGIAKNELVLYQEPQYMVVKIDMYVRLMGLVF